MTTATRPPDADLSDARIERLADEVPESLKDRCEALALDARALAYVALELLGQSVRLRDLLTGMFAGETEAVFNGGDLLVEIFAELGLWTVFEVLEGLRAAFAFEPWHSDAAARGHATDHLREYGEPRLVWGAKAPQPA